MCVCVCVCVCVYVCVCWLSTLGCHSRAFNGVGGHGVCVCVCVLLTDVTYLCTLYVCH